MPYAPYTQRQAILAKLKAMYEAVEPDPVGGPASADPWPFKFSIVREGPLSEADFRKNYSLGIVPGKERKSDRIHPFIEADWEIHLEFQAIRNAGDGITPMQLAEQVLGVIQRVFMHDKRLGGVVIDTKEVGSEIDLETYGDKTIVGVCTVQVKYRHDIDDTRPTV